MQILRVGGVGERPNTPMLLDEVTQHLPFEVIDVPLSVNYGPVGVQGPFGASFDKSLSLSVSLILNAIREATDPVILLGYSGGAAAVGHAASELSQHPELEVAAVGLVADPFMPKGVSPGAYGVAGAREVAFDGPTLWAFDERDPICCTPPLSPLRTIADQSAAMSLGDPAAWGYDLVDRLLKARWQPSAWDGLLDLVGTFRRYQKAADQARFYLEGGHVQAYKGYKSMKLAAAIMKELRR